MSWIRTVAEGDAEGTLAEAYGKVGAARGKVANILKIHSLTPRVMIAHLELYREIMFGPSELSRAERELVAIAVSSANSCHY
ncbi:MAG: carboxymuconolactone decarboxylase family protein [Acidobacteria bacterium]|nr:carboxymuconolactone decarboxylase family protein [Acidobacteriota bacterium]